MTGPAAGCDHGGMPEVESKPGGVVEIQGHRVGEPSRIGEILEVLGEPGKRHYRVRWDDGSETIFYPASDTIVRPPLARARKRT